MVLQQRTKVNVWGTADPDETITVQLGTESAQTTAGRDGNWGLKLDGLRAGGPYDMTISGKNSITLRNVVVGEVWVCSGESNMELKVAAARNAPEEEAGADLPMVRVFTVSHDAAQKPRPRCQGSWVVCDPDTVKGFSAIGYFFARELNQGLRTPVGIIQSAWGPSPVESWMPRATLEKDPVMHAALDAYDKAAADYPQALSTYQEKLAQWKLASAGGAPAASPVPHAPLPPLPPGGPREPAALYNGMIFPLARYPIRGVVWCQGESNTSEPLLYRKLFPAMIGAWRKEWNQGEFPFLYVQLPRFLARHPQPSESRWAELREAQSMALSTPRTGMAVTIDLGGEHDMHPADKQDVAHRLALFAQSQVYGKSGAPYSGPVFAGMKLGDGKASLSFTQVDGGLEPRNGPPLKGFAVAGQDRNFVWADAEIHGETLTVQSKEVSDPVAVRYAWADNPDCNLVNKANLPAAPFRTDAWVSGEPAASPAPEASPSKAKERGKNGRRHPANE